MKKEGPALNDSEREVLEVLNSAENDADNDAQNEKKAQKAEEKANNEMKNALRALRNLCAPWFLKAAGRKEFDLALTKFLKACDREVFPAFFKSPGARGRRIKSSDYFALASDVGRYFITKIFTKHGYPQEYLELWLETLHVIEFLKTRCVTDEEIDRFGFMVSELQLKAEIMLSFEHSASSVMHQGNHVTDVIDRHGSHNVVSNFYFERMAGFSVKPLKRGSSFKNPTWTMFARYLELRACELAAIKRGISEVVASARCSQYEAKLSAEEPALVPATLSFGKGRFVELKPPIFRRVKKADAELVDQLGGSHSQHIYEHVRSDHLGVQNKASLQGSLLPIIEMARNFVMTMTEAGSDKLLWPMKALEERYKRSRAQVPLQRWTPSSANTAPLSQAERIMQTGWNMNEVTFYQHVDFNGIRFRTEYRDKR